MNLFECLRILPTDYSEYGGEVKRWENNETDTTITKLMPGIHIMNPS
jgi:hypothetical protein